MEIDNLRVGDVLRRAGSDFAGMITEIKGPNVLLADLEGVEALFYFSPKWEKLSPEQTFEFVSKMKQPSRPVPTVKKGRVGDPAKVREQFNAYLARLRKCGPEVEARFESFWSEVVGIIDDKPGATWDMRDSEKYGLNPVIKIPSKRLNSTAWVQFAHLFGDGNDGEELHIIAIDEHVPEKYADLFPMRKDFYGMGSTVLIPYSELGKKKAQYLACFADILHKKYP